MIAAAENQLAAYHAADADHYDGWDTTGEVDPTDTETHGSDGPGLDVGEEQVH